jgi:hypothetical protein
MIKTIGLLVTLFFIIGCGVDATGIGTNKDGLDNSSGNGGSQGNQAEPVNIRIPSSNGTAPDGILQQLAWGPIGGGEGDKLLCGDCDIDTKESSIILIDFSPHQKVKVGIYRNTGVDECGSSNADFVTSVTVQVDGNGNLVAPINGATEDIFAGYAIDFNTNKLIWKAPLNIYSYHKCSLVSDPIDGCPSAPPQRLTINEMAYVCTKSETVKLREGPGKKYSVLKSLVSGADVKIIGGPKCADNWSWWEVETESGYRGWMSEGGDNVDKYFLCPAK